MERLCWGPVRICAWPIPSQSLSQSWLISSNNKLIYWNLHLVKHQCDTKYPQWQKPSLIIFFRSFILDHVPSTNMEEAGLKTYTAPATRWQHFWGAVIHLYSQSMVCPQRRTIITLDSHVTSQPGHFLVPLISSKIHVSSQHVTTVTQRRVDCRAGVCEESSSKCLRFFSLSKEKFTSACTLMLPLVNAMFILVDSPLASYLLTFISCSACCTFKNKIPLEC